MSFGLKKSLGRIWREKKNKIDYDNIGKEEVFYEDKHYIMSINKDNMIRVTNKRCIAIIPG